jgi:hypothetical protein
METLRSTFLFFRKHLFVTCFMTVILSTLFLTGVFLHGLAQLGLSENEEGIWYQKSRYVFSVFDGNKSSTEACLSELISMKENIQVIVISGNVVLQNEEGYYLERPLHTYYPASSSDIIVTSGTSELLPGENEVLVQAFEEFWLLFTDGEQPFYEDANNVFVSTVGEQHVKGFAYSLDGTFTDGLAVDYSRYFALTSSVDSVLVQCKEPLSVAEEERLLTTMQNHFSITGVTYPFKYDDFAVNEYNNSLIMYGVLVFACTLSAMKMFNYITWLRREEYRILRLVGATKTWINGSLLSMLSILSLLSAAVGISMVIFLDMIFRQLSLFEGLSAGQIAGDFLLFVGMAVLTGIIQMMILSHQNRKSMTEETI